MMHTKHRSSKKRSAVELKSMTERIADQVAQMSLAEAQAQLHPDTAAQLNSLPNEAEIMVDTLLNEIKPTSVRLKKYLMQETIKTLGSKNLSQE